MFYMFDLLLSNIFSFPLQSLVLITFGSKSEKLWCAEDTRVWGTVFYMAFRELVD